MKDAIEAEAWVSCTCDECEGRGRFADGFGLDPLECNEEPTEPLTGSGRY